MSALDDPRALLGRWRIEREVDDRRAGERHAIDGVLEITDEGDRLRWEERMVWHRPAGDVDVRRGLWLVPTDDGWWVRFEDGRDFHPWRPGEAVVHPCAPDTYAGEVGGDVRRWVVTWRATGPAKDYTMTSVLMPAQDGAGSGQPG